MSLFLTLALLLIGGPAVQAAVGCDGVTSVSREECEASLLLAQGIDNFHDKDYASAHERFQRIIDEYPQASGIVSRALYYRAQCEKFQPKIETSTKTLTPATSSQP